MQLVAKKDFFAVIVSEQRNICSDNNYKYGAAIFLLLFIFYLWSSLGVCLSITLSRGGMTEKIQPGPRSCFERLDCATSKQNHIHFLRTLRNVLFLSGGVYVCETVSCMYRNIFKAKKIPGFEIVTS